MSDFRRSLWLAAGAALIVGGIAHAQVQVAPSITPDARTGQILAARQAVLAKLSPVTDALLLKPPAGEWLQWRRTYDTHGFSPLAEVNKSTVKTLRPAWAWSLPAGTTENTPLEHDGVIFVGGTGDRVQALDAVTGDLLWEYSRPASAGARGTAGVKRNFAIYEDKLYVSTDDDHVVALDAKTGKVAWDKQVADPKLRYQLSSGPLVAKGKIIQGITGCSGLQPGGCYIVALDAKTGDEAWRFNTLAKPGDAGGESWNGVPADQRHGGSVWTTGSYDPELNLIYYGTGNTYDWQALEKGGPDKPANATKDGLYIDSTLALNPDTGKLVWHYQHLPEDQWDLDFAFEQQLITLPVNGKPTKLVVTTGKMIIIDAVDAATGKWVFSKDQGGIQNIVSAIDPKTGKKTINPEALPDLTGKRQNLQCPAGYGAKNWPANAYDPSTKIVYLPLAEVCGLSTPTLYGQDKGYTGGGQETRMARYVPNTDGNIGRLDAVNLETRKTVWSIRQRASVTSAALATAGGVVFAGDADRWFRAYDSATGKVLWQMRLNDSVNAYPITYSVKGKQYVAVVAGFGGPRIANLHQLTTEIVTPRGASSALWVFELPEGAATTAPKKAAKR